MERIRSDEDVHESRLRKAAVEVIKNVVRGPSCDPAATQSFDLNYRLK